MSLWEYTGLAVLCFMAYHNKRVWNLITTVWKAVLKIIEKGDWK